MTEAAPASLMEFPFEHLGGSRSSPLDVAAGGEAAEVVDAGGADLFAGIAAGGDFGIARRDFGIAFGAAADSGAQAAAGLGFGLLHGGGVDVGLEEAGTDFDVAFDFAQGAGGLGGGLELALPADGGFPDLFEQHGEFAAGGGLGFDE